MYLKADFLSVPISQFKLNSKAKNIILRDFPTKWITDDNGDYVEVFDKLYVASGEHATNMTDKTNNVLKLFGTSTEELTKQDWKGIASAHFRFKYTLPTDTVISKSSIYEELFIHTRVGLKNSVQFNHISYDTLTPASEIKADFAAGINLDKYGRLPTYEDSVPLDPEDDYTFDDDQNWYIAYADIDQQAYTREFSVKAATVDTDPIDGRTVYTTSIVMTYTIKEDIPDAISMDACLSRVKANNVYDDRFLDNYFVTDVDTIYSTITTIANDIFGTTTVEKFLRVDKIRAMKVKTFAKVVKAAFDFQYSLKKVKWWQKVVAIVVIIIVIIIAVVLTVASLGTLEAPAWYTVVAVIATAVALTATIISVALSLYMEELASRGYVGGLGLFKNTVVFMQDVAKYAGYVALIAGGVNVIVNGFATPVVASATAVQDTTVVASNGTTTVVKAGSKFAAGQVIPMSTTQIFAQVSSWLSTATSLYTEYENAKTQEHLNNKQSEVDAQNELIQEYYDDTDYSSPKLIEATNRSRYTSAFEASERMDNVPFNMTAGLVINSTTKYYD